MSKKNAKKAIGKGSAAVPAPATSLTKGQANAGAPDAKPGPSSGQVAGAGTLIGTAPPVPQPANVSSIVAPTATAIAARAHEIWIARGRPSPGTPLEDWLQAERE